MGEEGRGGGGRGGEGRGGEERGGKGRGGEERGGKGRGGEREGRGMDKCKLLLVRVNSYDACK